MNNKPVAWINEEMQVMFLKDLADAYPTLWKPLYTHPVKELTDEEIIELENALEVVDYKYFGNYEFSEQQWDAFEVLEKHAIAILRKAQEK